MTRILTLSGVALVLTALIVACSGADHGARGELGTHRGLVRFNDGALEVRPCGSDDFQAALDSTGDVLANIYNNLAREGQAIYVVFEGYQFTDGEVVVKQLHRADPPVDSPDCDEDLTGILYVARGNEPFWMLTIADTGIAFFNMAKEDTLLFPYTSPEVEEEGTVFGSVSSDDGEHTLQVAVFPRECRDSMSGAYFTLTAEVVVDGYHYVGCVMKGWSQPH